MAIPKPKGSYNNEFKQQNAVVAIDLATKLRSEASFKKDLRMYFRTIADEFEHIYLQSNQVFIRPANQADLRMILMNNYNNIAKRFDSKLRDQIKSDFRKLENKKIDLKSIAYRYFIEKKQVDDAIKTDIDNYIIRHSEAQSSIINETNNLELNDSLNKVTASAAVQGTLLTPKETAAQTKLDFLKKAFSRTNTIATTETQNISEYTKLAEANQIGNLGAFGRDTDRNEIEKQWVTILDERTRFSHVEVDGQVRLLNEPFNVDGYKMLNPGDPSLGAPIGIFINCRCSVYYKVKPGQYVERDNSIDRIYAGTDQDFVQDWTDEAGNEFSVVRGYATIYNQPGFNGYILKKEEMDLALKKLKDSKKTDLPMLYDHLGDTDEGISKESIIGYYKIDDLISTKTGLYVEGYISKLAPSHDSLVENIKAGSLRGFSIGTMERNTQIGRNTIVRDVFLEEISITSTPDIEESSFLPINKSVTTQELKPNTSPKRNRVSKSEEEFGDFSFED